MRLIYVDTTSNINGCPTLYRTVHGSAVVQGTTVDRSALPVLNPGESAVEVPAELLEFADAGALPPLPADTTVGRGILYRTERGTVIVLGVPVTDAEALAEMGRHGNGIPDYESAVEVPAELLRAVDVTALPLVELDPARPEFVVDHSRLPAAQAS